MRIPKETVLNGEINETGVPVYHFTVESDNIGNLTVGKDIFLPSEMLPDDIKPGDKIRMDLTVKVL